MIRYRGGVLLAVLAGLSLPAPSFAADAGAKLSAKQIVDRHVAARGGLKAWREVKSIVVNGKLDVGYGDSLARTQRYLADAQLRRGKGLRTPRKDVPKEPARKQVQVPFVFEMKRPDRSRFEIEFGGKTAVQVYDGKDGWLLRPYLNREDWEPFTAEQAKAQEGKWDLDGPVIDAAAQGTKVSLVKIDRVDGRDAYELALAHENGDVQHVWIDAKSFLDVRIEGTPRRMDGKTRTVWITQRDFRRVQGVTVPFVLETAVDGYPDTHKMILEKVALNPPLDDARFTKPRT